MRLFLSLVCAATMGCATSSIVEEPSDVKIGLIDIQKIILYSRAARHAREGFQKEIEARRTILKEKQDEIRAVEEGLRRKEADLTPSQREMALERLEEERKDLRRLRIDLEDELKKMDAQITDSLFSEIKATAEEFRKRAGYTVIFERTAVADSADDMDVTEEVIKLYNLRSP